MEDRTKERLLAEIDDLLGKGEVVIGAAQSASTGDFGMGPQHAVLASQWVGRIGELVTKLYGTRSEMYSSYRRSVETESFYQVNRFCCDHITVLQGLLQAMQHDVDRGLLGEIRQLLRGELFVDFIEMAEHLLEEGYKDAAAVLIGGVLENALRSLAEANSIPIHNEKGRRLALESLNAGCAAADLSAKMVQKQITSWGDLRNNAAHGQYEKYDADSVRMMLLFVQKFSADHLGA